MVGILAMADFRNSEIWNQARFAVCGILYFTESWSQRHEYRSLAKNIEHLSVSVLDNIAKGCEATSDRNFLNRAANTIDELEKELGRVHRTGALDNLDFAQLKKNLESVKRSLKHLDL